MTIEEVKKEALKQGVTINDTQAQRIADVLMPMAEQKFEGMQSPHIEYLNEGGKVKLRVGYTIE